MLGLARRLLRYQGCDLRALAPQLLLFSFFPLIPFFKSLLLLPSLLLSALPYSLFLLIFASDWLTGLRSFQ